MEVTFSFPQELVDHTVDQLHDDRDALIACSLTSNVWLSRTRHHLFHTIRLIGVKGYTGFEKFLRKSPRIAPFVRHIYIDKCRNGTITIDRDVLRILPKLSHMEHLEMRSWEGRQLSDDARSKLPAYCAGLKSITLDYLPVFIGDLLALLFSSRHLRSVALSNVAMLEDTPSSKRVIDSQTVLQLDTLKCDGVTMSRLQRVLASSHLECSVRRLEIRDLYPNDLDAVQQLLPQLGESLQNISFVVRRDPHREWDDKCSLVPNPQLIALHFSVDPDCYLSAEPRDALPAICIVLSLIKPIHVHLQTICIAVDADCIVRADDASEQLEWTELDTILANVVANRPLMQVIFQLRLADPEYEFRDRRTPVCAQQVLTAFPKGLPRYFTRNGHLGLVLGSRWEDRCAFGCELTRGDLTEHWFNI